MTEAKHTPGPWVIFKCEGISTVMPAGRPGDIADNITNERDADLIAAAPDLLAALIDIMRWYDAPAAPLSNLIGKSDDAIAMFDRARAAVAKAEGRDPIIAD